MPTDPMEPRETPFQFEPDRAISELEADRLDRGRFVESLTDALVHPSGTRATGVTIGLAGRWGEGKSSVLHLVHQDLLLRFPKTVVVDFSPWLVSRTHDLLHAFFDELCRAVGQEFEERLHGSRLSQASEELTSALGDYVERVAPAFDLLHPGGGQVVKVAMFGLKQLSKVYQDRRARGKKLPALKARVEALLEELRVPVVVLVDEVDRIDDREIRGLMHLVKAVADFPTMSYLLAYDEVRVAEALGFEASFPRDRITRGRKYLEKIVQIPIQLPITFDGELLQMLDDGIRGVLSGEPNSIDHPQSRYGELRLLLVPSIISTARDVRRLVSSFAHRLRLVSGEVEWVDVLGFVALTLCAPDLANRIRQAPDDFVFDGSMSVHSSRGTPDDRFKSITEVRERTRPIQDLFSFLFPAVSKKRQSNDCFLDQIAWRRPLRTTLRMNALTTAVSRADVVDADRASGQERNLRLVAIANSDRAVPFAERLADLIRTGAITDAEDTWIALLEAVERIPLTSWTNVLRRMLALRDVTDTLISLAAKHSAFAPALRNILETISGTDALEAASILVRRTMVNYERGNVAFQAALLQVGVSQEWLREIARAVIQRAKERAMARLELLHVAEVYLAREVGEWDNSDRARYEQILNTDDRAFDNFMIECFGEYYMTDGRVIEDFFMDFTQFKSRVLARWATMDAKTEIELRKVYEKVGREFGIDDVGSSTKVSKPDQV